MVRIIMLFNGEYLYPMLTWIGAITALTAVVSALAQTDVKRLLAYHSISQLGYILAVFAAGSSIALTASFFHAANHALFKSLLFLSVGAAVRYSGERNLYRMGRLGGEMPVFAVAFFAGALSISGIPPFNGFASKAFIVSGMEGSKAYPLLWITSFLTVASFIKLGRIYLPGAEGSGNRGTQGLKRTPGALETISVSLLALACAATGIFGTGTADFLNRLLYGTPLSVRPDLFSVKALLKTLPVAVLGIAAYKLVLTETGQRLSRRVKAMAPPLQVVLVLFLAGLMAFAAAAY
jgi:formate hydrogenlyase subunit 3/multisubunit Na+/H+ antiporter MnhD subunit